MIKAHLLARRIQDRNCVKKLYQDQLEFCKMQAFDHVGVDEADDCQTIQTGVYYDNDLVPDLLF